MKQLVYSTITLIVLGFWGCSSDGDENEDRIDFSFTAEVNNEKWSISEATGAVHIVNCCSSMGDGNTIEYRLEQAYLVTDEQDLYISFSVDNTQQVGLEDKETVGKTLFSNPITFAKSGGDGVNFGYNTDEIISGVRIDLQNKATGEYWTSVSKDQPIGSAFTITSYQLVKITPNTMIENFNFIIQASINCTLFNDQGEEVTISNGILKIGIWDTQFDF